MGKKLLISAFAVLNVFTVLYLNRPKWLVRAQDRAAAACPPPVAAALRDGDSFERSYASAAGLDPTWQMFGALPRSDWWYVIKAEYADGQLVVLPLPLQSERTFWQEHVADFKEAKFHLNLYTERPARRAYALYLARAYPEHDGSPVKAVVWELHYRPILPPEEARRRGTHRGDRAGSVVLDTFPADARPGAAP